MSKAKWFAVRKPSTGEIIAKSANQIVPPKFRGGTKILYYIHQTPLSSWRVEGGSGDETSVFADLVVRLLQEYSCGSDLAKTIPVFCHSWWLTSWE